MSQTQIYAEVIAGYSRRWWRWALDPTWRELAHIDAHFASIAATTTSMSAWANSGESYPSMNA